MKKHSPYEEHILLLTEEVSFKEFIIEEDEQADEDLMPVDEFFKTNSKFII